MLGGAGKRNPERECVLEMSLSRICSIPRNKASFAYGARHMEDAAVMTTETVDGVKWAVRPGTGSVKRALLWSRVVQSVDRAANARAGIGFRPKCRCPPHVRTSVHHSGAPHVHIPQVLILSDEGEKEADNLCRLPTLRLSHGRTGREGGGAQLELWIPK